MFMGVIGPVRVGVGVLAMSNKYIGLSGCAVTFIGRLGEEVLLVRAKVGLKEVS